MRPWYSLVVALGLLGSLPATAHPGHDDQLRAVNSALAATPDNPALYLHRGNIYAEIGHYDQARADFQRARELGPGENVDLSESALYLRKGDHQQAMVLADRHIARFPDDPSGYEHRSLIARAAGNHPQALADLQTYFQLHAQPNPGLYVSAATMLEADKRREDALAILDQGMERLGIIPQLQRPAIELELSLNRAEAAVERMTSLRQVLRDSASWKVDLAALLLGVGRGEEAAELLAQASNQLQSQRATPARAMLEQRIKSLTAQLPS